MTWGRTLIVVERRGVTSRDLSNIITWRGKKKELGLAHTIIYMLKTLLSPSTWIGVSIEPLGSVPPFHSSNQGGSACEPLWLAKLQSICKVKNPPLSDPKRLLLTHLHGLYSTFLQHLVFFSFFFSS